LTKENIKRLQAGKPVVITLKEMDEKLGDRKVLITYGETENDLFNEMLPLISLDNTKIHLP
jgi:hypothetical protein